MSKYAAKGALRTVKNYTKGYSNIQSKVREATSNDPWGPSGTLMNEIAQATYHKHLFMEVMEIIDKRLNDKGKNWRHVFKALMLLDYCLHVGSESVIAYARENLYVIKTLKEFQYLDERGKDVGANIRQKAKEITNLLQDESRLQEERRARIGMHDRLASGTDIQWGEDAGNSRSTPLYERPGYLDDDRELQRAIEESKRMAQEHENQIMESEQQLKQALEESEREAKEQELLRLRQQQQEQQRLHLDLLGQSTNFAHQPQQQQPQQLGFDFFDPLSSTNTSTQPSGFGAGNFVGGNFQQPFAQQQQPISPFSQQNIFPTSPAMPPLQPITSASNNPFGNVSSSSGFPGAASTMYGNLAANGSSSLNTQSMNSSIGLSGIPSPSRSPLPQSLSLQQQQQEIAKEDDKYAKLSALLGSRGDGVDTFGNVGNLRVPYGSGFSSSVPYYPDNSQTASNPFGGANSGNTAPTANVDLLGSNGAFGGGLQNPQQPFGASQVYSPAMSPVSPTLSSSSAFGNSQLFSQQQANRNPFQTAPAQTQVSNNPWASGSANGGGKSLNDLYLEQQRQKQQGQFGGQQMTGQQTFTGQSPAWFS
ncbi:uncharacterized protein VTP21DRAFT_848 [Calcarisporiella thermophila]|uniref:uncharacterized protein n=1 Tax=Calcarisporiella thermophila TaxID=911321 RepID=UPI00374301D8